MAVYLDSRPDYLEAREAVLDAVLQLGCTDSQCVLDKIQAENELEQTTIKAAMWDLANLGLIELAATGMIRRTEHTEEGVVAAHNETRRRERAARR